LTGLFKLTGVNLIPPSPRCGGVHKEDQMRSRTIAIAGSIAALALAATPVAAVAATSQHAGAQATRTDRSRDTRGVAHVDRTHDKTSLDRSIDVRDR
jgi:hypothetical protein